MKSRADTPSPEGSAVITLLSLALLAHLVTGQVASPAAPRPADDDFQCGSRVFRIGDRESEVLFVCGSPLLRDQRQEERRQGSTTVTITVDVWTYDRGPFASLRTLTFENGRLVEILASGIAR
jgi:hypothetical protein